MIEKRFEKGRIGQNFVSKLTVQNSSSGSDENDM